MLENVIGITGGVVGFTCQLTDPFENLLSVFFAVFAHDLSGRIQNKAINKRIDVFIASWH